MKIQDIRIYFWETAPQNYKELYNPNKTQNDYPTDIRVDFCTMLDTLLSWDDDNRTAVE